MREKIIELAKKNGADIIGFAPASRFAKNDPIFPVQEPRKIYEKRRIFHENRTYEEAKSH